MVSSMGYQTSDAIYNLYLIFSPKHLHFCFSFQHSGTIKKLPKFVSALDAVGRWEQFSFPEYLENPRVLPN